MSCTIHPPIKHDDALRHGDGFRAVCHYDARGRKLVLLLALSPGLGTWGGFRVSSTIGGSMGMLMCYSMH